MNRNMTTKRSPSFLSAVLSKNVKCRIVTGLIFLALVLFPMPGMADSAGSLPQPVAYFSGVVTATQGNVIQIDHNNYSLHKELTVKDDEGRERKLNEFKAGNKVDYHLKRGKVDELILKLAR